MLNPFLGSAKVKNAYFLLKKKGGGERNAIDSVQSFNTHFHNIFHDFLLFHIISKMCLVLFVCSLTMRVKKINGTLLSKHVHWRLICPYFTEVVWALLTRLRCIHSWANRSGEWELHLHSFESMLPYFMRNDHTNYALRESTYVTEIQRLPEEVRGKFEYGSCGEMCKADFQPSRP